MNDESVGHHGNDSEACKNVIGNYGGIFQAVEEVVVSIVVRSCY